MSLRGCGDPLRQGLSRSLVLVDAMSFAAALNPADVDPATLSFAASSAVKRITDLAPVGSGADQGEASEHARCLQNLRTLQGRLTPFWSLVLTLTITFTELSGTAVGQGECKRCGKTKLLQLSVPHHTFEGSGKSDPFLIDQSEGFLAQAELIRKHGVPRRAELCARTVGEGRRNPATRSPRT